MTDIDYEALSMDDWLRLPASIQQQVVASYIGAGRKLAAGREKQRIMNVKRQTRPTRRELDEQYDLAPAWPAGEQPSDRWTEAELKAYNENADHQIAQDGTGDVAPLDLNRLDSAALKAIASCTTHEQVEQIEKAIRAGQPLPTFAHVDDRQSIVQLAAPKWSKT